MPQYSDDDARNLRAVYLGPEGFRALQDFTYMQYGVSIALGFILGIPIAYLIPAIITIGVVGWIIASFASRFFERRTLIHWTTFSMFVSLYLLLDPSPAHWILPLNIFATLALVLVAANVITAKVGKHITGERPIGHWLSLPMKVADAPRRNSGSRTGVAYALTTKRKRFRK